MAGKVFLVVDRVSLGKVLTEADAHDRVVVAEGAFDAVPNLTIEGARWRLNGWSTLPIPSAAAAADCGGYARTWAALAQTFDVALAPTAAPAPSAPSCGYSMEWASLTDTNDRYAGALAKLIRLSYAAPLADQPSLSSPRSPCPSASCSPASPDSPAPTS